MNIEHYEHCEDCAKATWNLVVLLNLHPIALNWSDITEILGNGVIYLSYLFSIQPCIIRRNMHNDTKHLNRGKNAAVKF